MKKHIKPIYIVTIFAVIIALVSLFIAARTDINEVVNVDNNSDTAITKVTLIDIYNSSEQKKVVEIPTRLTNDTYYMYLNQKRTDAYTPVYFKISSINTFITVSVDNAIIFETMAQPKLKNLGYPSVHLVEIPQQYDGQDIKLTFSNLSRHAKYTNIPRIQIGSKQALIADADRNNYYQIILSIVIFMISYVTFFASLILFKAKRNYSQLLYISVFSVIICAIILINTELFKLILAESTILYYVYYILFTVIPIPLLLLSCNQLELSKSCKWRCQFMRYVFYIEMFVVLYELYYILQNYKQPVQLHVFAIINIALVSLAVAISFLTLNGTKHKIKPILLLSTIPLFLIIVENFELYFGFRGVDKGFSYTPIYALIYLLLYFFIALNTYYSNYKQLEITKFYEEIAFVDSLTRVSTRHALEKDIQLIQTKMSKKIIIMFIDVNLLKKINDENGHTVGDTVLKTLGELINEVENIYNNAKGYRFGGDEFIIILKKPTIKTAENIKLFLKTHSDAIRNSNPKIPISLAIAYDEITVEKNMNIEQIIKNADKKMYLDKEKL